MAWYNLILNRIYKAIPQKLRVMVKYAPAGVNVSADISLKHPAVWAAHRVISETIGSLSVKIYQPKADGGKEQINSATAKLLARAPNSEMTAQAFYEALTSHVMGWGNAFAEIERDLARRPIALWPIPPDRVEVKRDPETGRLYYLVNITSGKVVVDQENMLHVHGLGWDGVIGYDVFSYMSDTIGLAMGANQSAMSIFKNGMQPSGALCAPKDAKISPNTISDLKNAMNSEHGGVADWFKSVILTDGIEWKPFTLAPQAAQLLETRKFTRSEIASIYRIPPHMIGDLEKATFSNIEQQSTDFAMFCILPWVIRWEQEINRKLLKGEQFCKFNINTLMRGDMAARYNSYQIGRQWGWLSANDIRGLEDMDPIEGIAGTAYLAPLNFQLASDLDKPKEQPAPKAPADPEGDEVDDENDDEAPPKKGEKVTNFAPLVDDLIERATNRIYNALADKYPNRGPYWPEEATAIYAKFDKWLQANKDTLTAAGYTLPTVENTGVLITGAPDRETWRAELTKILRG
jgi:HK97 family phage portal protein